MTNNKNLLHFKHRKWQKIISLKNIIASDNCLQMSYPLEELRMKEKKAIYVVQTTFYIHLSVCKHITSCAPKEF